MADSKLTGLTATTGLLTDELLYTVKDPSGTPLDRKISYADFFGATTAIPVDVKLGGGLYIQERASAKADIAGYGQIWVKNVSAANELWWTDDTGADAQIQTGAAPGGSNTQMQYNNSGSFGGLSTFTTDGTNVTLNGGTLTVTGNMIIDSNSVVSLSNLDAGTSNTIFGKNAGDAIGGTAVQNSLFGEGAGGAITNGDRNTCIGYNAGNALTTGNDNTAIGNQAGLALTSGGSNVFVGNNAGGALTTGSNCVIIGASSNASATGSLNQYIIGNNLSGTTDDAIFIGDSGDHIRCDWGTDATWDKVSDVRRKNVRQRSRLGLDFINDLKVVEFTYKAPSEYPTEWTSYDASKTVPRTNQVMHGVVAQDVRLALDNQGVADFSGWSVDPDGMQRVGDSAFVYPLIRAVQEVDTKVVSNEERIAELEEELKELKRELAERN